MNPADLNALQRTHRELSEPSLELLQLLLEAPDEFEPTERESVEAPSWARDYAYELHPWPTLLGADKLDEVRNAAVSVARLTRAIPERIFDLDFERIASYYRMGNPLLAALLLEPPNGIDGALARLDFVDTGKNFDCIEVNSSAYLGGWQPRFWRQLYRAFPRVAGFLEERSLVPRFRDPMAALFRHVIQDNARNGTCRDGELNLVLAISENLGPGSAIEARLDALYRSVLEQVDPALEGTLRLAGYPDALTAREGRLFLDRSPVHAVIEYTSEPTPEPVFRCLKSGTVTVYNGPLSRLFGDKRNLALLYRHRDSDRFNAEERAAIRAHVPWTAEVTPGRLTFQDHEGDLEEIATAHRRDLVLKPAQGSRGDSVFVGCATPPEEWRANVLQALGSKMPWILQEYGRSRPYLFPRTGGPPEMHHVVWGLFAFGDLYGGGFLRITPADADGGVINSARGAVEGLIFEV